MSKICWASQRGNCGRGISREHLISKGIFDQDFVYVQGFEWCKDQEVKISLNSLTSKVLCGVHNNGLSEVDTAGIAAIRQFDRLCDEPGLGNSGAPIDGHMFERWLLKTAVNLSFGGNLHIGVGMTDSQPGWPAPYLLAIVFGDIRFTHKMGAYFLYPAEECQIKRGEISVVPIHKNEEIGGIYFHLRGIDVFLSLFPGHSPSKLRDLGFTTIPTHILDATMQYRPESIVTITNRTRPVTTTFCWKKSDKHGSLSDLNY